MSVIVRPFHEEDTLKILEIYKPYILHGSVTFETEVPDIVDFTARLSAIAEKFPFLVLEDNGEIMGYAYANLHRERVAYRWNVETSIYMHPAAKGKGWGRQLYSILLEELTRRNFTRAYALIGLPNEASVALHSACGFKNLVVHEKAGWKDNAWIDVLWMIRELHEFNVPPQEPVFGPFLEKIKLVL
jgi:phosphinothricin acetyltransferase